MTFENLRHGLSSRTRFCLQARPGGSELLCGHGNVEVLKPDSQTFNFNEAGLWTFENGLTIRFHNTYSWCLQSESQTFGLSHLRYGWDSAVHLVDFIEIGGDEWESASPYACGADLYRARINYSDSALKLSWKIHGPAKRQQLDYAYLE